MEDNSKEEEILKHISIVKNDEDNTNNGNNNEKTSKNKKNKNNKKNKKNNKNNQNNNKNKSGKREARIDSTHSKKDGKKFDFRNMTKKQKIITGVVSVLVLLVVVLGVVFGTYIHKAEGNVAEAVINMATDVLGEKEPIFVLALGISEDISNPLTDTIILGGYNPDSQKAFMVSIPRDTFIGKHEPTANGYDKINALYQKDVQKTVKAVEDLTGINIDNYVVVKNTVLPDIVNAIGSVEFDVPIDMDYDDPTQDLHIHLKKGVQMIDGEKAELLLRFRHNNDGSSYPYSYGDNDYGRMRTQREFMKKVAEQLISLNNVSRTKEIATAVFKNLETDITLSKALSYVPYGLKFDTDSLVMEQLPGSSAMINDLWFYKASKSKTKDLIDKCLVMLELEDDELEKCYNRKINQKIKDEVLSTPKDDKDDDKTNTVTNTTTNTNQTCTKHDYQEVGRTKGKTCTSPGIIHLKCTKCGATKDVESEPIGHKFDGGKTCKVCGAVNPDYEEPKECKHEWEDVKGSRVESTCKVQGSVKQHCKKCNTDRIVKLDLAPHKFVNGKCTVCGEKEKTEKPDEGSEGETTKPCSHNWVVKTKIPASCEANGSVTSECSKCKATKTDVIKATGHKFVDGKETCTNPGCNAKNPNYVVPSPNPVVPDDDKDKNEGDKGQTGTGNAA